MSLAAAISMIASACGVGPHHVINTESVTSQISSKLAAYYSVPVTNVICPSIVTNTKGQTFVCTALLDGQHVDVNVTSNGNGNYSGNPKQVVENVAMADAKIAAKILSKTHEKAQIDCGSEKVLVLPANLMFTCHATVAGQAPLTAVVTYDTKKRLLNFHLVPAPG